MGGGLGFLANEIKKIFSHAAVYTFDVSRDAKIFGDEHFPEINYITKAIEIGDDLSEFFQYDVIIANEFYPFTRINDWEIQKGYIDTFLNNLEANGILIIEVSQKEKTLLDNIEKLKCEYKNKLISISNIPKVRIYKRIQMYTMARILTRVADLVFHDNKYFIIIGK